MKHIIQKLVIEINVSNQEAGEAFVNDIGDFVQTKLLPQLEAYFAQLEAKNTLQRIERLDLDLGTVALRDFPENTLVPIEEKITTELKKILKERYLERKVEKKSVSNNLLELFNYYLENGIFPWWSTAITSVSQLEEELLGVIKQEQKQIGVDFIWNAISTNNKQLERLVYQFSSHFLSILLNEKQAIPTSVIQQLQLTFTEQFFSILQKNGIPNSVLRKYLWLAIMEEIVIRKNVQEGEELVKSVVQNFIQKIQDNKKLLISDLLRSIKNNTINVDIKKHILTAVERLTKDEKFVPIKNKKVKHKNPTESLEQLEARKKRSTSLTEETDSKFLMENSKPETSKEKTIAESTLDQVSFKSEIDNSKNPNIDKSDLTTEEQNQSSSTNESYAKPSKKAANQLPKTIKIPSEIYLSQAGIVLIHAMLPPFFQRLGLVKKGKFINQQAQVQAIYLLHLLGTEQENPTEEKLFLYKLLCGYPLTKAIPPPLPFSEATKTECEKMLAAVIGYWKIMPNTTPRSLRGAFLQRPGKLARNGEDWLLQLESAAHDMLLDYAPWGLGLVRFSWMEGTLLVEWGR